MGLAYFKITAADLETLRPLILRHESELVGPRARGYWADRPETYDYAGVQQTAQALYQAGIDSALDTLELSENEAHSLSMLEFELPGDGLEFPPSLFMSSAGTDQIKKYLKLAARKLGPTPEIAIERLDVSSNDPRYMGYLQKQVNLLRKALPKVWHFYADAERAGQAVLVVDLRARDLETPEEIELAY